MDVEKVLMITPTQLKQLQSADATLVAAQATQKTVIDGILASHDIEYVSELVRIDKNSNGDDVLIVKLSED